MADWAESGTLTTIFTPPTHCVSDEWTWGGTTGRTLIYQNHLGSAEGSACFPSSVYDYYGKYSPGICPLGYSTAHTSLINGTVTSVQCCPTGYEGFPGVTHYLGGCSKSYTTSTTVKVYSGGTTTTGPVGPGIAQQFQIIVLYQSSDLSLFPPEYTPGVDPQPTTSEASPSSTESTAAETGAGANPTGTPPSQNSGAGTSGISTGAKAGIGAGIAVGVLAVLAVLLFFFMRRRRLQGARGKGGRSAEVEAEELDSTPGEKNGGLTFAELQAHDPSDLQVKKHELHGNQIQELPGHAPVELADGNTVAPVELFPVELAGKSTISPGATSPLSPDGRAAVTDPAVQESEGGVVEQLATPPSTWHEYSAGEQHPVSPDAQSSTATAAATEPAVEPSATGGGGQPMPTTIEELELQYLESEARRIQQRKDELLAARGRDSHGGQ